MNVVFLTDDLLTEGHMFYVAIFVIPQVIGCHIGHDAVLAQWFVCVPGCPHRLDLLLPLVVLQRMPVECIHTGEGGHIQSKLECISYVTIMCAISVRTPQVRASHLVFRFPIKP